MAAAGTSTQGAAAAAGASFSASHSEAAAKAQIDITETGGRIQLCRLGLRLDELDGAVADVDSELRRRLAALPGWSGGGKGAVPPSELWKHPQDMGSLTKEVVVASYVVHLASVVAKTLQDELVGNGGISKKDTSPVTVADFSVQAIVLGLWRRHFPADGFIAEERSSVLRGDPASLAKVVSVVRKVLGSDMTEAEVCECIDLGAVGHVEGGRTVALDPIDGTKGFILGEQFCCAFALLDETHRQPILGVLGCPNLPVKDVGAGVVFFAAKGRGTFVRSMSRGMEEATRCNVRDTSETEDAIVVESRDSGHTSHGVAGSVCKDLGISKPTLRMDSQVKYGLLACGEGDIYLRLPRFGYRENIWDHAAGEVVVTEAGGCVSDSRGGKLDYSQGDKLPKSVVGIVATSKGVSARVVAAVSERQREEWVRTVQRGEAEWKDSACWGAEPRP